MPSQIARTLSHSNARSAMENFNKIHAKKKEVARKMQDIKPPKKHDNSQGHTVANLRRNLDRIDRTKKHVEVTHEGKRSQAF